MKSLVVSIGAIVAALSLTYGLGIASASSSSTSTATKVGTASSKLGRILVDRHGRALYLFAKDRHGKSACSGLQRRLLARADRQRASRRRSTGPARQLLGTTPRATAACRSPYRRTPALPVLGRHGRGGQTIRSERLTDFGGGWWVVSPAGNKIVSGTRWPGLLGQRLEAEVASKGAV